MTAGELARMFNERWGIGCELEVVKMDGWSREFWFDQTGLWWVQPSPNIPTLDSATVFPGTVHLEGTRMSEGRGTTRPFEIIGAPYVKASEFARRLNSYGLLGVNFRPSNFLPTFQKHAGTVCGGVQIHVVEREQFEPVKTGVAILRVCMDLYADDFQWKEPPYEYVFDQNPFDVIAGTDELRKALQSGDALEKITDSWKQNEAAFESERAPFLLY